MRPVIRAVAILGLAVSVAACSTAGQGSGGGLGESAGQTIRDHPQTAAGAGVGAAGGAVVGGLAGGTKGAVIGGLVGALAGGAIGNYMERREATTPQTTSTLPQTTSTLPPTVGTTVGVPGPTVSRTNTNGAAVVRVDQVQVQPALLRPGETVNLNATYTILSPSEQLVAVRETREVRLNGELVANPAVEVARQTGTYSSALPITLPANARTGRYEVTTTVVSGDRQSSSTTSFSVQ
jgi:uncharacterized protein YcfJ